MRIGILELLTDVRATGWVARTYANYLTKQFASVTPQAIAVWCRELGHEVHYRTYYGQADPHTLRPKGLDVVFIGSYTRSSGVAYALASAHP